MSAKVTRRIKVTMPEILSEPIPYEPVSIEAILGAAPMPESFTKYEAALEALFEHYDLLSDMPTATRWEVLALTLMGRIFPAFRDLRQDGRRKDPIITLPDARALIAAVEAERRNEPASVEGICDRLIKRNRKAIPQRWQHIESGRTLRQKYEASQKLVAVSSGIVRDMARSLSDQPRPDRIDRLRSALGKGRAH